MPHLPAAGRKSQKPAYRQAGTKVHKMKFEPLPQELEIIEKKIVDAAYTVHKNL